MKARPGLGGARFRFHLVEDHRADATTTLCISRCRSAPQQQRTLVTPFALSFELDRRKGGQTAEIGLVPFNRQARFAPTMRHAKINVMGLTPGLVKRWIPILGIWGVGASAGLALYLSDM